MSYSGCVARIAELDALLRRVDPGWATSGYSMADYPGIIADGSTFTGVLEGLTGEQSIDGASAAGGDGLEDGSTGAVGANVLSATEVGTSTLGATTLGTSTGSVYGTGSSVYGSNIYHKFNVIGLSPASSLSFESPLPGAKLTQAFGPTTETLEPSATVDGVTYAHYHDGLDLAAPLGSTVRAAASGTVTFAGRQSDGAVVVKIRHADGYTSLYGHLDPTLDVSVGQQVSEGQPIGKVGMTGNTTGPHVHFSLYDTTGTAVDPATSLRAGCLPDPSTLLGPSAADPAVLTAESGSAVLARFDAVSSQIPYADEIRQAAVANGIDPLLLTSIVRHESNFHPNAVSSCGAMGLTQLMPRTAQGLGVTEPFDPQQNLNGGAAYIARQLHNFGRVDLALAAYNAGPGTVSSLGAVPDSTRGYVSRILNTWSSYQEVAA